MKSNGKLKVIDVKNRTCYYFDDILKIKHFDLDNILADLKSYKNILVYDRLDKNLTGAKPMRIRFNKIDGFINVYDGSRYLFTDEIYDFVYNRTRYLVAVKSDITYVISYNFSFIQFFTPKRNTEFASCYITH